MKTVQNGDSVKVNYTGRLEDGSVFDSSLTEGREPLAAILGNGQLIKGFESGLMGMSIGDKKTIEIEPVDAYGEVIEGMVSEVPLENLPQDVKVGDKLQGMTERGPVMVVVTEVNEKSAKVDANHPLAGKKLIFDLELVSID
jgi:FKBP-type peptidyl-prolyl cis-trans isomerase 2